MPGNSATSGNSSNSENSEVEGNYSSGTVGDIESDDRCNKLQRHPQSHRRKSRKIQRHSTGDNSCSSPELTQKQKPNKYLYSGRAHHTEARDSHSTTLVKGFQATQSCNNSDHSEPELYQPQQVFYYNCASSLLNCYYML